MSERWARIRGPLTILIAFLVAILVGDWRREVPWEITLVSLLGWAAIGGGFIWWAFGRKNSN
jgi:hypothetical protein